MTGISGESLVRGVLWGRAGAANDCASIIRVQECMKIVQYATMIFFFYTLHYLPVAGALERLVLDHLNPVVVRVKDERHVSHATIGQALLPVDIQALEAIAGGIKVINGDT